MPLLNEIYASSLELPNPADFPGLTLFAYEIGSNQAAAWQASGGESGAVWSPMSPSYIGTFNNRLSPALVRVGAIAVFTDAGGSTVNWRSDGSALWKPPGGRVVLALANGSLSSPLETQTGATTGNFTTKIPFPASFFHAQDRIITSAQFRKRGTGGTVVISAQLGTAGNATDGLIMGAQLGAGNNRDIRLETVSEVVSNSSLTRAGVTGINADSSATATDAGANFDATAVMKISFAFSSGNAADSYDLIAYLVELVRL